MEATQPVPNGLEHVLPSTARTTSDGELVIGGCKVVDLVAEYGTPLHIYDEEQLRQQMRAMRDGLKQRWPNSDVLFASKAAPITAIYAIAASEDLVIDVAGGGELELALSAGCQPERIYYHGNAKSDAEITRAVEVGVGLFIVDSEDELARLERIVPHGKRQQVLIRVIPGIDAETHQSMNTGGTNSKFGLPVSRVVELIEQLKDHPQIDVVGVHVHIGSQILNVEQFGQAVAALAPFGGMSVYDLGGGLGVAYHEDEHAPTVDDYLDVLVGAAKENLPANARLLIEPGRSSVARAGVSAYQVVVVKHSGRHFIAIDGGMADQLEIALTGQKFTALLANRAGDRTPSDAQLVGRQCESGDLMIDGAPVRDAQVGDVVVMPATGAYSYTMTNNYNGALRPAVVLVKDGEARLATRRETYEDLLRLHEPAGRVDWSN